MSEKVKLKADLVKEARDLGLEFNEELTTKRILQEMINEAQSIPLEAVKDELIEVSNPQILININNTYNAELNNLEAITNAINYIKYIVEATSEHLYICITKNQLNDEKKWLRTNYS